jgi:hypothetical protein
VSASRAKGTGAETAVVNYLRDNGFPHVERRAQAGTLDRGDIAGVIGTVIEVKNCSRTELAEWVKEANREAGHDGATYGVVWHKRRGYSNPAGWFVTMDGHTFTQLLRAALGLDETVDAADLALARQLNADRADRDRDFAARLAADHTTVLAEIDQAQQEVRADG